MINSLPLSLLQDVQTLVETQDVLESCKDCGAVLGTCIHTNNSIYEAVELAETKAFTHKIYTGPVMSHDKGFLKKLHGHYPNVNAGTEHVYVHTDHPAEHVADTLKNKMGISGFKANDFRTRKNSDKRPTAVVEDNLTQLDVPDEDAPEEQLSGGVESVIINPEYKTFLPRRPY